MRMKKDSGPLRICTVYLPNETVILSVNAMQWMAAEQTSKHGETNKRPIFWSINGNNESDDTYECYLD